MREILFRGKDKLGCWHVGNLLHLKCEVRGEVTTEVVKIHPVTINMAEYPTIVDPATVSQYTGVDDKDGRKIFKGDILKFHFEDWDGSVTESLYRVVWHNSSWMVNYMGDKCSDPFGVEDGKDFEVVGNVWDNPELLEVGQ